MEIEFCPNLWSGPSLAKFFVVVKRRMSEFVGKHPDHRLAFLRSGDDSVPGSGVLAREVRAKRLAS